MHGPGNWDVDPVESFLTLGLSDSLKSHGQADFLCCKVVPRKVPYWVSWALFLLQEQELKAAADGVLSEVRKKQADTKRMVDILRALEKLRKLRKEAAARKGNHGFAFLSILYPSPLLPKTVEGKMLDTSLFSPSRVTKLISSTSELLK